MSYAINRLTPVHISTNQLVSCFHQSFDESTLKDLQGAYRDPHSFSGLLPLLRRSSYPWVVLSVDRLFSGPIAQISCDESRSVTLRNLGLGWISLSRFFLNLYIPDTPLDPAALQSFRSEFWGAELASLSHELELEVNLERRISGNMTNGTINYLDEQIRHVRERTHNLPHLPRMAGRWIFLSSSGFLVRGFTFALKIIPEARLNHIVDSFYANSLRSLSKRARHRQESMCKGSINAWKVPIQSSTISADHCGSALTLLHTTWSPPRRPCFWVP